MLDCRGSSLPSLATRMLNLAFSSCGKFETSSNFCRHFLLSSSLFYSLRLSSSLFFSLGGRGWRCPSPATDTTTQRHPTDKVLPRLPQTPRTLLHPLPLPLPHQHWIKNPPKRYDDGELNEGTADTDTIVGAVFSQFFAQVRPPHHHRHRHRHLSYFPAHITPTLARARTSSTVTAPTTPTTPET